MKRTLLFTLLWGAFSLNAQNTIVWTPPVEVTGSSNAHRPRIDLLADNTPVLIWGKFTGSSNKDYFFSKWDGTGFPSATVLNDVNILTYDWGGTDIVADGNTLYTVYKSSDVTVGKVFLRRSTDGGATWEPKIQIEQANELAMYPSVEAYGGNTVMVTYMVHGTGGSNPQYIVRTSNDGGQTFSSQASVSSDFGAEACYCCPPAIVGNSDYQVMSFRNDDGNIRDMKAGVSTNGGATFDTQISLDDHYWIIASCPSSGGDVVLNGSQLYSTYMSKGSGDEMIYFVEDDLSDATVYTEAQAVELGTTTTMNHPHLTNLGDSVLLVWQQTDQGETNIWYNFSETGMSGWQTSTAAPLLLDGTQTKPDVAMGSDGSIHLVYHDLELDRVMYTKGSFSSAGGTKLELAQFQIHPNPTEGNITLTGIEANTSYLVTDLNGKTVLDGRGEHVASDVLDAGVYIITIEGYQQQKFVVK